MIESVVLRLRVEHLARATRPFPTRGDHIRCCQCCLLSLKQRLCVTSVPAQATSRFCLVVFDIEPIKPNNTDRFIIDILPDTEAFQQLRTEPSQGLSDLVVHPDYRPMVVFPASYAGSEHQILSAPPSGRPLLFIMLDGTWIEAHKMSRKSPYLDVLPVISVGSPYIPAYHLCGAYADGQYCTAEVVVVLLDLVGDTPAVAVPDEHFTRFRTRCPAGKTQRRGSIITGQVEDV